MNELDVTEAEILDLISQIDLRPQTGEPYCKPGEVCRALLFWRLKMKRGTASRRLAQLHLQGVLQPAWVDYTDPWGITTSVRGYKRVEETTPE